MSPIGNPLPVICPVCLNLMEQSPIRMTFDCQVCPFRVSMLEACLLGATSPQEAVLLKHCQLMMEADCGGYQSR